MKCLGCGCQSWSLIYQNIDAEVAVKQDIPNYVSVTVNAQLWKCNSCDQTSADNAMMEEIAEKIINKAKAILCFEQESKEPLAHHGQQF